MPLRPEDLERDGVPISFLRPGEVEVWKDFGATFLRSTTIPLDGRIYICAGKIILRDGRSLRAEFRLYTDKRRPFNVKSLWCTPDDGKNWYSLDDSLDTRELLAAISAKRGDVFPIQWLPDRPLEHEDHGPYAADWSPGRAAPKQK